MLPYFPQPTLHLGPLTIHAFGVLVAIAVLFGAWIARHRALRAGLDPARLESLLSWVLAFGFIGGHVLDELFYEPAHVLADPLSLLRIWEGLGSFGGFAGAVLGALLFAWRRGFEGRAWAYLDAVAYAFPFGWIFGRLGCTVAYDHPGIPTKLFFGQEYSDHVVRHNLGLEEAVLTLVLALVFFRLGRKPRPDGYFVGMLALLYAPVRFLLDTLRIADARYFGATPAQYGAVLLGLVGVALLVRAHGRAPRSA
jgi:phosphatidylglycerol:prolipoprotein diacylglycerol transferase